MREAREITAVDILARLRDEFPGTTFAVDASDTISIAGENKHEAHARCVELRGKMRLFNGHANVGHVRNTRNWWRRV